MATATRARRGTKAEKAPEPTVELVDEDGAAIREPSEMHELMADYFNENYDADVTPLQCAIYTSKRGAFRRSDAYKEYRERAIAEAAERKTVRAAKAADKSDEEVAAPARQPRARRTATKTKAAEAEAPAAEPKEKAAAPARRRRTAAAKTEVATETATAAPARRRRSAPRAASSEEEPF